VRTVILACLCLAAGLLAALDLTPWVGVWVDTETDAHFRVEKRGDNIVVVSSFNFDNGEIYEIQRSRWDGQTLSWTIYIRSSDVTLTYTASQVTEDKMYTRWQNNWNSGEEILQRWSQSRSGSLSDWEGVWVDTQINVHMTIKRRGSRLEVVSAIDMDNYEAYEVIDQSYFDGVLDWTIYIPSTDVWINYRSVRLEHDRLVTSWETEFDKGQETLVRFH